VTVAADVVFAGSLAFGESPNMFALDARTGEIVWSFAAGSSVNAGPAVVDGVVYWGSGYDFLPSALWTPASEYPAIGFLRSKSAEQTLRTLR
jgi:outer membrane protein assembly factor BamB